jgi:hypothetical protein
MAQENGSRFKLAFGKFGQYKHLRCPLPNGNHHSWDNYLLEQVAGPRGEEIILGQFRFNLPDLNESFQSPGSNNLFRHSNFFGYFIKEKGITESCVDLNQAEEAIARGDSTIFLFPFEIEWGNLRYLVNAGPAIRDHLGNEYRYKLEEIITPQIVRLAQTGKFKLVITNIVDPAESTMYYDVLDGMLEQLGIPTEHIVWLSGHIPINAFKPDRKSKSLYIDSILSLAQAAENYLRYPCITSLDYVSDLVRPTDLDRNKKRNKRFLCFNRSLNRPYRIAMIYMALKHNLLPDSTFSFITNLAVDHMEEFLSPYLEEGDDLQDFIEKIKAIVPYEIDTQHLNDNQKQSFSTVDNNRKDLYENSYFHIAAETRMGEEPSAFLSEKTWRPILNLQPFIHFGGYQALKKLKELGFKTFDDIIDESYDDVLDPIQRFKLAQREVVKLRQLSMDEIHNLYYSIYDKLVHNQQVISTYLNFDPLKELSQIK